jgi:hypothetical protein
MKGKIAIIMIGALTLGLVILLPSARAQLSADREASSFGAEPEVAIHAAGWTPPWFAGTYVAETDFFPPADPDASPTLYAFHTLAADGTMTGTNTNCCGRAGNLQSPVHGVWKRTGWREITLTAFGFVYLDDGSLLASARIVQVLTFDADFKTAEAVCTTALWFGIVPDFEVDPPNLCVGPWDDHWTRLQHAAPCQ